MSIGTRCLAGLLLIGWQYSIFAAEPPNIVVILADDLGWSDTGAYGNSFIDTPNIDRLAAEGVHLTRFYTNPVCSPSRVAIHSGQYAARLGVTDFISGPGYREVRDDDLIRGHWRPFEVVDTPRTRRAIPTVTTVATVLKGAGYETAYFGKWHMGFEPENQPDRLGYSASMLVDGVPVEGELPALERIHEATADFLDDVGEKPFFLFLSPTQPHIPLKPQRGLLEKYRRAAVERGVEIPIPAYAAVVHELDAFVGEVRELLQERNLLQETVFIFLSDNGGLENYDLGMGGRVTSNLPLRGEKGTLYEGGIRVPLIVRWPGELEPGVSVDALTASYDLLPTLAQIAAADLPADVDGESFLSALRGTAMSRSRPVYFHYPHYHHDRPASAMIDGNWKLIEFLDGGEPELFDLASDPGETTDLTTAEPERAAAMRAQLNDWRTSVDAKLPVPNPNYDPERAAEWWAPFSNAPIDVEMLRRIFKGPE